MQRVVIVGVFCFNLLVINSYAQKIPDFPLQGNGGILWKKNHAAPASVIFSLPYFGLDSLPAKKKTALLPVNYHTQHWGFFCAQEWKWEKKTKFPIKMRLGSVEYVDRMEGKKKF